MKRTTVKLPPELDALLHHEADRRGMTASELVREALVHHLRADGRRPPEVGEPGHGGRHLTGERIEEALGVDPGGDDRHHVGDHIEELRAADHDRQD